MPFKKGKSGNPSGRRKQNKDVTALALKEAPEAFKRIVEASRINTGDIKAYVYTNNLIVERAYGKAPQAIALSGADGGPITINVNLNPPPRKPDA